MDPENPISLAAIGRLLDRSVEVTGCQHFGLLVGQQGGLRSFGLVGVFARYSPDLQTALGRLGRVHTPLPRRPGREPGRSRRRGDAQLFHQCSLASRPSTRSRVARSPFSATSSAVSAARTGFRSRSGLPTAGRGTRGPSSRPSGPHCSSMPSRAQSCSPPNWLRRRRADAEVDTDLQRLLARQIESLEASYGDEFPEQVRSVLRSGLLAGP